MGNHLHVCLDSIPNYQIRDSLPQSLNNYGAILLFSNSTSKLSQHHIEQIVDFVEDGGGLYAGAENWPLQAESNQVTHRLYKKESFGDYESMEAEVSATDSNLELEERVIPAGKSTVAFPMDYRLKVEVWIEDQPLILSGKLEKGKIIIDGGYSRFYCDQRNLTTDRLLLKIIDFLLSR